MELGSAGDCVMKGPRGGLDVYIDKGPRGPGCWKQPPKRWFVARRCFLLGVVGSAATMLRVGLIKRSIPVALFGGAMFGLYRYAGVRAQRDTRSKP